MTREEVEKVYWDIYSRFKRQHLLLSGKRDASESDIKASQERMKEISPVRKIQEAATEAFQESLRLKKEALRGEYLKTAAIERLDKYLKDNTDMAGASKDKEKTHVASLIRFLVGDKAGRQDTLDLEARINGIRDIDMADLYKSMDEYAGFWGFKLTEENSLNIVKEMDGVNTGDNAAKEFVTKYHDIMERGRKRKNELGADIGKLKDWNTQQVWSPTETKMFSLSWKEKSVFVDPRKTKADRDAVLAKAKQNFIDEAFNKVDRERYVDKEGMPLNDEEMRKTIGHIFDTITTRGLNEMPVSLTGQGNLAKSLGEHRELHFKSAMEWYEFNMKAGKFDLFENMINGVMKNARDTALMEAFGPNPMQAYRTMLAHAAAMDSQNGIDYKKGVHKAEAIFGEIMGTSNAPVSERGELIANASRGLRQWMVATKMGKVLLSQTTDLTTYMTLAQADGLGMGRALRMMAKGLNPLNKNTQREARLAGIALNTVMGDVASRFGEGTKGVGLTSRAASMTVKLAGMNWWTDSLKLGYQMTIAGELAHQIKSDYTGLEKRFQNTLKRYGIDEGTWDIIRQADTVNVGGEQLVSPIAIRNLEKKGIMGLSPEKVREAAVKIASLLHEESDTAQATPGAREMAFVRRGQEAGTAAGEMFRSMGLFHTFSVTMVTKVLPRIMAVEGTKGFKAGLAAQFALGMIVLGGASVWLKDISAGKNPRPMFDEDGLPNPRFWISATLQSGGLGIFGDFIHAEKNRFGQDVSATLAGPIGSLTEDSLRLTIGNAMDKFLYGKDVHWAADVAQYLKNQTPVINLWYTRAALDHLLFFQIQEAMNPGYLRRMRNRVEEENRQSFWWKPNQLLPEEAPDVAEALGGK